LNLDKKFTDKVVKALNTLEKLGDHYYNYDSAVIEALGLATKRYNTRASILLMYAIAKQEHGLASDAPAKLSNKSMKQAENTMYSILTKSGIVAKKVIDTLKKRSKLLQKMAPYYEKLKYAFNHFDLRTR